jgi:hypothetical protein
MQMLALGPEQRSGLHQPWRAWLETVPAARLLEAPGLTLGDRPLDQATAALIAGAGFRHAMVEIAWDHVGAEDDGRMRPEREVGHRATLAALAATGVRPTILLSGVVGGSPVERSLVLARPAAAGDRELWLEASSAARVRPGRTRLREAGPTIIVTLDPDGHATLSRPLPRSLAAGVPTVALVTRYAPFRRPTLADGRPDPTFAETLEGWRRYVRTTLALVAGTVGGDAFDLEVWNIYRGARDFFDVERYYDPAPADLGPGGPEAAAAAVVAATIEVVRTAGLLGVRVANGFANRAWVSGGVARLEGVEGVGAVGRHVDGSPVRSDAAQVLHHFPELGLTALGAQPLYRDLSPLTVGGETLRSRGQPVWLSSLSLGLRFREIPAVQLGRARSVFALRGLVAYTHKGAQRVMLYQHEPAESLIGGPGTGGPEARAAIGRFLDLFRAAPGAPGVGSAGAATPLSLEGLTSCPSRGFAGAGADAPTDGDLFAFFPFAITPRRLAAVVYVMSRDPLRAVLEPSGARPARFGLRLAGVPEGTRLVLVDPLRDASALRAELAPTFASGGRASVELDVTDAPQVLLLDLP